MSDAPYRIIAHCLCTSEFGGSIFLTLSPGCLEVGNRCSYKGTFDMTLDIKGKFFFVKGHLLNLEASRVASSPCSSICSEPVKVPTESAKNNTGSMFLFF